MSAEQLARDMLERAGVENAQSMSAGDLTEIANLIAQQPVVKQPWPNHNWCVGCSPGNCSGCGTEPYERRKQSSEPVNCKYGNEPKSCTSSPMDCQCALDATMQSSEPVANAIYQIYAGLGNWQEVNKSEYEASKSLNKRVLVTANENDFCYAELKDIYDEMYQHKDIARVANRLCKLIYSRTLPPSSVPLEKYNKLLDALNKGKNALASARFLFLKHLSDHNWLAGFDKDFEVVKQAIDEAEGKEG